MLLLALTLNECLLLLLLLVKIYAGYHACINYLVNREYSLHNPKLGKLNNKDKRCTFIFKITLS